MTPLLKKLINVRCDAYRKGEFHLYEHHKENVRNEFCKAKSSWITKMKHTKTTYEILQTALKAKRSSFWKILCPSSEEAADGSNHNFVEYYSDATDWNLVDDAVFRNDNEWKPDTCVNNVRKLLPNLNLKKISWKWSNNHQKSTRFKWDSCRSHRSPLLLTNTSKNYPGAVEACKHPTHPKEKESYGKWFKADITGSDPFKDFGKVPPWFD